MNRFPKALFTWSIATAIAFSSVSTPASAKATNVSNADKAALKRAVVACKAQARGKRIRWLSRRRFVNDCVTEAMKNRPNLDVMTLLKDHPNLTDLPVERWPGF